MYIFFFFFKVLKQNSLQNKKQLIIINTQSTLWAFAHSSGCWVLGACPSLTPSPVAMAVPHPQATLWAVVHRHGGRYCVIPSLPLTPSVIPHPPCWPVCTSPPPYKQLLIAEGSGAVGVIYCCHGGEGGTWLLAPSPPCKQVLAAVGNRCWGHLHPPSNLVWHHCHSSTCDPPHEQLFMRLEAGSAL